MKPRKVIITIEAKSDVPSARIKEAIPVNKDLWQRNGLTFEVHQVSVQVVKEGK